MNDALIEIEDKIKLYKTKVSAINILLADTMGDIRVIEHIERNLELWPQWTPDKKQKFLDVTIQLTKTLDTLINSLEAFIDDQSISESHKARVRIFEMGRSK